MTNRLWRWVGGSVALIIAVFVFLVPFAFMVLTAGKTQKEAAALKFSWPTHWAFFDNLVTVLSTRDFLIVRAFVNSTILTVGAVAIMVVLGAMVGYVLQRRRSRWNPLVNFFVLAGQEPVNGRLRVFLELFHAVECFRQSRLKGSGGAFGLTGPLDRRNPGRALDGCDWSGHRLYFIKSIECKIMSLMAVMAATLP